MISIHGPAALVVASLMGVAVLLIVSILLIVEILLVVSVSSVVTSLTSVEFVRMLLVVSAVADSSITRILLYPVTSSGGTEFPTPH